MCLVTRSLPLCSFTLYHGHACSPSLGIDAHPSLTSVQAWIRARVRVCVGTIVDILFGEPKRTGSLLSLELAEVEVQLRALKNVAISATVLAGARRDDGQETAGRELVEQVLRNGLDTGNSLLEELGLALGDLLGLSDLGGLGSLLGVLVLLGVLGELETIVLLIPLTERCGIDLDNGVLYESVSTHQLVVRGVVDDSQQSSLLGDGYSDASRAEIRRRWRLI
jgi:hypothetical protein